MLGGI